MIVYDKDGVTGTRICQREWVEYIKLVFKPCSQVEPHRVSEMVDFYILNGSGVIIVNGREIEIQEDSLVSVTSGAKREVKAGNSGLEILVIKHLKI